MGMGHTPCECGAVSNATAKNETANETTAEDTAAPTAAPTEAAAPTLKSIKAVADCSVELTKQESQSECKEGTSFGCEDNGNIYVDKGCRGQFKCNDAELSCASVGNQKQVCECKA